MVVVAGFGKNLINFAEGSVMGVVLFCAKDVKVNPLHAKITAKGLDKEVSTDLNVESIDNIDLWREVNGIKPDIKNIK